MTTDAPVPHEPRIIPEWPDGREGYRHLRCVPDRYAGSIDEACQALRATTRPHGTSHRTRRQAGVRRGDGRGVALEDDPPGWGATDRRRGPFLESGDLDSKPIHRVASPVRPGSSNQRAGPGPMANDGTAMPQGWPSAPERASERAGPNRQPSAPRPGACATTGSTLRLRPWETCAYDIPDDQRYPP